METIDAAGLAATTGGGLQRAWDGAKYAYQGAKNFTNGVVAGAIYGPGGKSEQIERFNGPDGNTQAFKPGVEIGMMGNMAMGPVGGMISTLAGSVPTGSGGAAR